MRLMAVPALQESADSLSTYLTLLERWNRVYNLTAIRDREHMVTHHVLDSLSIWPWVRGPRVLDVGSGAGLPGIPLAVIMPTVEFHLLDSNGKRCRFLSQAVLELGLDNVRIVRCRAEMYRVTVPYQSVVSRAFATVKNMLLSAGHLCAADGQMLAMKGVRPDAELGDLPAGYRILDVYPIAVPGLAGERHLVHIVPIGEGTGAG
jgi:16S rRNA (guanine527-N7)-methyltransferase